MQGFGTNRAIINGSWRQANQIGNKTGAERQSKRQIYYAEGVGGEE